ncbi:serine/threonine-protein kinase [Nannocystis sp. RBIL2]|uniref:serine/threonine-protein kinase n=1 Tax=Nannocystis sp. RBIL2 TaxID=2996788 RepID=UPI00226F27D6|nr:serine/threonine-protein kinase [Nannocystis sp. RBIL2]
MAGITLLDRQEAVRDLETRLRHALLLARLGSEQLVSSNGRLMIVRLLGYGASGVVCEALDRKLGRKVALKLYPGLAQDALAKAVRTEAQTLAALRHRNIVVVHDFDADEFRPGELRCFLVAMELLSGTTLRHWMAEPHPAWEVLDVFCRAGDGLAAAHAGGIVHRDFKPENVMLDEGGEPKLVDFGLAILDSPSAGHLDSKNPEQRAIVGTLAYMAPEALRGRAEARSDQFSFAAALWEALCGEFPYPIDDLDPSRRVVSASPKLARGVPPALFDCLRRALLPDPTRRFPRMTDLVAHLREFYGELRSAASIASAPTVLANVNLSSDTHQSAATAPAAVVSGRSWSWLAFPAVGVATVVGVLAALGFWSAEAPPPPEELLVAAQESAEPVSVDPATPPPSSKPDPSPPPAPASAPVPARFDCPGELVTGEWFLKDTAALYSLELRLRDKRRCRYNASLKNTHGTLSHREIAVEEFAPLLGAATGKFVLEGLSYDLFLTFESDKVRGHVGVKGNKGSLLVGSRSDRERNRLRVADDQPCATRCIHCRGLKSIQHCRAQCAGERDGSPGCSDLKDP